MFQTADAEGDQQATDPADLVEGTCFNDTLGEVSVA